MAPRAPATMSGGLDAVVVGAGPNGLAAAVALARAGRSVRVLEAAATVGGGARSGELTEPGFVHDLCSAIHPLVPGSPFLAQLPLERHGLELVHPPAPLAHPFDDGTAAMLERSVTATAETVDPRDAAAYRKLMEPLAADARRLLPQLLEPLSVPRHPLALARFARDALLSAHALACDHFSGERARGLFAGLAGHSMLPLDAAPSAAFGLVLALAGHAVGWPFPRGGAGRISEALAEHLRELGGEIECERPVRSLAALPRTRAVLCDLSPRGLIGVAGDRLPRAYRRALARYRYGYGAFKLDYALDGPIPWRASECTRAATVHLGGTLAEITASEAAVERGEAPERPYVLLAQPSLFDETRAPAGKHTAWAYCHLPNGSTVDMSDRVEAQIERFAPGFRDRVIARVATAPADLERYNPNYIGGDINGGRQDLRQLFTRPVARPVPYRTPVPGLYLCSASTPPGGGVHGMCGWLAAQAVLRRELR